MQKLLLPFFMLVLLIVIPTQTEANALKKSSHIRSLKIALQDGEAGVSLDTRFSLDTIAGAPKIVCSGIWTFEYVIIDGSRYNRSDLPAKVVNALRLYDVDILYGVGSLDAIIDVGVECDPGVFHKSGSSKASFTTPASPNWDKSFRTYGDNSEVTYYDASRAKAHMKHLRKKGELPSEAAWYGGVKVLNASLDVFSIRQYIKEKEKEDAGELEDLFGEVEGTDTGSGSGFDEMFDDSTEGRASSRSLEDLLEESEKIRFVLDDVPERTDKNVITISGVIENISSIDESSVVFKLNGLEQRVYLNKNGSFSNKVVLFNGQNKVDVIYTSSGKRASKSMKIYSSTPPVKARFTLTWDSTGSDMDLHVHGPSGDHCYYSAKSTPNMTLDVDNTKQYGPENVSVILNKRSGTYKVYIKHFKGNAGNVTLYVYLDNRLVATKKAYLSGERNWHAYDLDIN